MVLYFTGTGNSGYVAERIGKEIEDETLNLFDKIRENDTSRLYSEKPWVIVSPTYSWRIPRILSAWLGKTILSGNKSIYFVMTCGDEIGNAGEYVKKLCASKGLNCLGCAGVIMPENYIALFKTPGRDDALKTVDEAEGFITSLANMIKDGKIFLQPEISFTDKLYSGVTNDVFYPLFVKAKKFYATDACVSCGICEKVCPLKNVEIVDGKPVWGNDCTHCMACICKCPKEAIEYGKHSKGLPRYVCPKNI